MAENFTIDAQPRTVIGKKVSRLRREGLVPAVIYGAHVDPVHLQIPYRPLQVMLMKAGGTHLIEIGVDGQSHTVLARQVQRDILRGDILHVDFLAVDMNQKISTQVPIHIVGESPAVETRVGNLTHALSSVTVEALPRDLIFEIQVDISVLKEVGDSIHVRDLNFSDKVTILNNDDELIVHVTALPQVVEEVETLQETGAAEPELVRREREDEDEE